MYIIYIIIASGQTKNMIVSGIALSLELLPQKHSVPGARMIQVECLPLYDRTLLHKHSILKNVKDFLVFQLQHYDSMASFGSHALLFLEPESPEQ